nr:MAG TPA: Micro-tubular organizer [Caudoviricetes sp.]
MMKIYENGIIRVMTAEEVAEFEKLTAEMEAMPTPESTAEERIASLEQDNAELREALEALLSGVTA